MTSRINTTSPPPKFKNNTKREFMKTKIQIRMKEWDDLGHKKTIFC
jgi:hypothetical protein